MHVKFFINVKNYIELDLFMDYLFIILFIYGGKKWHVMRTGAEHVVELILFYHQLLFSLISATACFTLAHWLSFICVCMFCIHKIFFFFPISLHIYIYWEYSYGTDALFFIHIFTVSVWASEMERVCVYCGNGNRFLMGCSS